MNQDTSLQYTVFGKLPARDDFVRLGPADEAVRVFDRWLGTGVEWALARSGAAFRERFATGAAQAFVYRAPGSGATLLVGALVPSRDRIGRPYPLLATSTMTLGSSALAAPHALPLVFEDAWQVAGQLVTSLAYGTVELDAASLEAEAPPPSMRHSLARDAYGDWTRELALGDLWRLLYGEAPPEQPARALQLLVEAARYTRGLERPDTPLSLRLPLGSAAGAAVCFWIDLVRRVLRWRETVPSFFWTHDGETGCLLLHLGNPPVCTVSELWLPTHDRDEVLDLAVTISAEQLAHVPPLPPPIQAALTGSGAVNRLLDACAS